VCFESLSVALGHRPGSARPRVGDELPPGFSIDRTDSPQLKSPLFFFQFSLVPGKFAFFFPRPLSRRQDSAGGPGAKIPYRIFLVLINVLFLSFFRSTSTLKLRTPGASFELGEHPLFFFTDSLPRLFPPLSVCLRSRPPWQGVPIQVRAYVEQTLAGSPGAGCRGS